NQNVKCAKKVRLWPEGGIEVCELLRAKTTGGRRSLSLSLPLFIHYVNKKNHGNTLYELFSLFAVIYYIPGFYQILSNLF
ncbi:MAG: hypothetical protein ACYSUG_02190, partial [Planctomycetota bacterium]